MNDCYVILSGQTLFNSQKFKNLKVLTCTKNLHMAGKCVLKDAQHLEQWFPKWLLFENGSEVPQDLFYIFMLLPRQ